MPRKPRLHVPGGIYHVTLRGNHRQRIFRREADRDRLDEIVQTALARSGARLHAFVWMTAYAKYPRLLSG
jgi:REP-associated tyrosine transposase